MAIFSRILWGFSALAISSTSAGESTCSSSDDCDAASLIQMKQKEQGQGQAKVVHVGSMFSGKKRSAGSSKPFFHDNETISNGREGKIIINEDGVDNTYYLPGAETMDGGKTVKYTPPYRFYLMKTPTTDYKNRDAYYMPIFPGKTFTVDINLNGVGCGCNLNFYLVNGPVDFPGGDNDYYCDGQCFPDKGCCSEFDQNEGNAEAQQVTNHACTNNYGSHPDWVCNKWGDPIALTHHSDFAPGTGATIDSNKPFTYSQRYDKQGNGLTVTTEITQGDRKVTLRLNNNEQMESMLRDMESGMVFVTGYWFDQHMNWLDKQGCGQGDEHCSKNPAYISNWRLTTNGGTVPSPSVPTPGGSGPSPGGGGEVPSPGGGGGGGCCTWGGGCGDCGWDGTGWCHKSASNCAQCGGWFDGSKPAPGCR